MAEITAALVKDLREKSGVGMMDCKKALIENNGDIEGYLNMVIEHRKFIEPLRGDRVGLLRTYNTGFQTYVNQHRYWEYEAKFLSKHIGDSEDSNVTKTYIYIIRSVRRFLRCV